MFGIIWESRRSSFLVGLGKGFSSDQHERMNRWAKDLRHHLGRADQYAGRRRAAGREIQLTITTPGSLRASAIS